MKAVANYSTNHVDHLAYTTLDWRNGLDLRVLAFHGLHFTLRIGMLLNAFHQMSEG